MTELSDELLVAYVDGQLARDQSKAVERVLENDEIAAQRVEAMRAAHTRLEAAFDAMLANELSAMTDLHRQDASAAAGQATGLLSMLRQGGAVAVIGGAMCLVMAGAVAGYALRATPEPTALVPGANVPIVTGAVAARDWRDDLIIAHMLFGRETLTIGLETQGNIDLVRFQLANAVGTELQIPDLRSSGLEFSRAQLFSRDGDAIAQLAYLPEKGDPVALYARWDKGSDTPSENRQIDGVSAAGWRQQDVSYLLAGRMPLADMVTLAQTVRRMIADKKSLESALVVPLPVADALAREAREAALAKGADFEEQNAPEIPSPANPAADR